ncbi:SDR family NAD(P)-dependent oxidoreductase [Pseudonocardia xinjiangensis]|uniref:SDR family NAD(P)-dependent oxidoreductase n=1 Tax=Pseudonocardia xinjiangensis TaxID=75289 RepID=A0ABX1RHR2_9PSEU|nr:SDR family NAD(P)-dependent oxidoreductase [Pseudonocardia xinjiangensis]NMH78925.1 SDR family NAD(P)-dependent oxidoreductase [Pseudonocardia xinjiangensis]
MTSLPRNAVVTGASSGIGAAVAERLAHHGCRLLLVGRDRARLDAVALRCGGRALVADLRDPAGVAAVSDAADGWAQLLVHGAGVGAAGPLADTPAEVVDELLTVNLVAPVQLTRALVPTLRTARGHVVFVASVAAIGVAYEAAYSATKAGLRGFADALRVESDIGVTTVLPGAVTTPYYERRGQPYHRRFPRPVSPERVAGALVDAVRRDRAEVFVPRWLTVGARVHGVAPAAFAHLSRRMDRRPDAGHG